MSYPGLPGDEFHALASKYLPHGTSGVVSFEIDGGREAACRFMEGLEVGIIATHVADARTCCLCPSATTHRQMTPEQLEAAGIPQGLVRLSCGLEASQDIIEAIDKALELA